MQHMHVWACTARKQGRAEGVGRFGRSAGALRTAVRSLGAFGRRFRSRHELQQHAGGLSKRALVWVALPRAATRHAAPLGGRRSRGDRSRRLTSERR